MGKHAAHVSWSPIVDMEARAHHHGLAPLHVALRAGEVLYLPSHWLHAVSQRGAADDEERGVAEAEARTTIAVRFSSRTRSAQIPLCSAHARSTAKVAARCVRVRHTGELLVLQRRAWTVVCPAQPAREVERHAARR